MKEGYVDATTNCGDPHAMVGNEGEYQSIDAMLSSNASVDQLNAANNKDMRQNVTHRTEVSNKPRPLQMRELQRSNEPGVKALLNIIQTLIDKGKGNIFERPSCYEKAQKIEDALIEVQKKGEFDKVFHLEGSSKAVKKLSEAIQEHSHFFMKGGKQPTSSMKEFQAAKEAHIQQI